MLLVLPKNHLKVIEVMKNREMKSVEGEPYSMLADSKNNILCFSTYRNLTIY